MSWLWWSVFEPKAFSLASPLYPHTHPPIQPIFHWRAQVVLSCKSDHVCCVAFNPLGASQKPQSYIPPSLTQPPFQSSFPTLLLTPVTLVFSLFKTFTAAHLYLLLFQTGKQSPLISAWTHPSLSQVLAKISPPQRCLSWWPSVKQPHSHLGGPLWFYLCWSFLFKKLPISQNEKVSSMRTGILSWLSMNPQVLERCLTHSKSTLHSELGEWKWISWCPPPKVISFQNSLTQYMASPINPVRQGKKRRSHSWSFTPLHDATQHWAFMFPLHNS